MTWRQRVIMLATLSLGVFGLSGVHVPQVQGLWVPKAGECYLRTDAGTFETIQCPKPAGVQIPRAMDLKGTKTAALGSVMMYCDPYTDQRATALRVYQYQGTDCTDASKFSKVGEYPVSAATAGMAVTGLTEGLTYCWYLTAIGAGQESDKSSMVVYTVPGALTMPAPQHPRVQ